METRISLPFADGDYEFWLPMARVVAAEREMARLDGEGAKQPYSILMVYHGLGAAMNEFAGLPRVVDACPVRLSDAHAVIRNALVGGGGGVVNGEAVAVGEAAARELVETYCFPNRPAAHDMWLAFRVLRAAIDGIDPGSKKNSEEAGAPGPDPS